MKIAIHSGAHGTEEDRLLKSLLGDAGPLLEKGVTLPGPGKYRTLLKECFSQMDDGDDFIAAADDLWNEILDGDAPGRVVLSNPHFFGSQREALNGDLLYPNAERRLQQMSVLFPDDQPELFLCIRNPATFLPGLLGKASKQRVREVLSSTNPMNLRWSSLLARIHQTLPDLPVTVWCYEDLPFIWDQVLRAVSGLERGAPVGGELDMLSSIMTREGTRRLGEYLADAPDISDAQRVRVYGAFVDKFAQEDALEEELDLPGWDDDMVDTLSDIYDGDVEYIAQMPGCTLIEP